MKFSNKRHIVKQCPCGRHNNDGKFIPFQNYEDKGHCYSCGKTFFPKQEIKEGEKIEYVETPIPLRNDYNVFDIEDWMKLNGKDSLSIFLNKTFNTNIPYAYSASEQMNSATIFILKDINGTPRNAKKIIYDSNGKRIKKYFPVYLKKKEENYCIPFFNEEKINSFPKDTMINIVESEKTAIICQHQCPSELWLASGGSNGITKEKASVLYGRRVTVWLDCDKASRDSAARSYKNLKKFHNEVTIKDPDPSLEDGTDLADIILKENY